MVTPASDTRDRVIRLEERVKHMEETLDSMSKKVSEMHSLLQQARGARWLLIGVAMMIGAAGGFFVKIGAMFGWAAK
jgi:uncharacterized protein YlxW (UPF0749 family)